MRIIIILSLLGLTACNVSHGLKETPISGVHSNFKAYVDEYCDIKQEVLNYCKLIVNKGLYKRPFNIKVYIAAVNIRLTGDPDWKELVLRYA